MKIWGAILMISVAIMSVEGMMSSNFSGSVFTFPDLHLGCNSTAVEAVQPFHENVEHAINTVVSQAPETGTFHSTHQEQKGGVSVEVEADCSSATTRCSDCLRTVSDGLLHFCEAHLIGVGRVPANDGCSLRYQAYGNF
jgi:hypothetical protein